MHITTDVNQQRFACRLQVFLTHGKRDTEILGRGNGSPTATNVVLVLVVLAVVVIRFSKY